MKSRTMMRAATIAGLGVIAAAGAAVLSTASVASAKGCPPVFEPVICISNSQLYYNQCLADLDGATGCYDIPVDPYPGPGGDPEDQ